MRTPRYLSPTSITKFYADRSEFYLSYLADQRPPRLPQTKPMSIGSAFDAYIKNYLVERLYGVSWMEDRFDLRKIFEEQVEEHNRDWAWVNGKHVFESYQRSGAISDLMIELEQAAEAPRFEFTVEDRVSHETNMDGVPLLGKPDVYFITKGGDHIIFDFKVNGYCSKSSTSPKPGYLMCRDGWDHQTQKPSRGHRSAHKDFYGVKRQGILINAATPFEQVDKGWADQLSIYAWLLGAPVGGDIVMGIEQLVSKAGDPMPLVRIASHRGLVSPQYQVDLYKKICYVWDTLQEGAAGIFRDTMTAEESEQKCLELDNYHKAFSTGSEHDDWFTGAVRQHSNF
jgi:hypothetical protein